MAENIVILDGKITAGPHWGPGPYGGSVDFELRSGSNGIHQVVSGESDIVAERATLKGRVRVYGRLSSVDGDSVILASRIEFL